MTDLFTEFAFVGNRSWLIDTNFYFLGYKNELEQICSAVIRTHFLLLVFEVNQSSSLRDPSNHLSFSHDCFEHLLNLLER